MVLSRSMTVYDLLVAYPFLDDFLVAYHPVFTGLAATHRRETWGRVVTLGELAVVMDVPWRILLRDVQSEVERVRGTPPALDPEERATHQADAAAQEVRDLLAELERGGQLGELAHRMDVATGGLDDAQVASLARRRRRDVAEPILGRPPAGASPARALGPGHPVSDLRRENERLARLAADLEEALERYGEPGVRRVRRVREDLLALLSGLDEVAVQRQRLRSAWYPTLSSRGGRGPSALVDDRLEHAVELGSRLRRAIEREDRAAAREAGRRYLSSLRAALSDEEELLVPFALRALDRQDWEALGEQERAVGWALQGSAPPS